MSGGQRQSISIARALAGRPPVLVFDEPSSAMDAQTEADLIYRLQEEIQGRTFLLITHRTPCCGWSTGSSCWSRGASPPMGRATPCCSV
ncbi:ATP-binding cassette domain-containing protein [Sphingobium scionense]